MGDDNICATSLTKTGKLKTYAICKTRKREKTPSPPAGNTNMVNAPKTVRRVVKKKKKTQRMPEELEGTGYDREEETMIKPEGEELPNRKKGINYIAEAWEVYTFKAG